MLDDCAIDGIHWHIMPDHPSYRLEHGIACSLVRNTVPDMSELLLNRQGRARAGRRLVALLEDFENGVGNAALLPKLDRDLMGELLAASMPEEGAGVDAVFDRWEDTILPNSTT